MHEPADIGVIWDMDGTLVASATVVPDAFIETVTRLGGSPPDRDGVVALYDLGDPQVMLGRELHRALDGVPLRDQHGISWQAVSMSSRLGGGDLRRFTVDLLEL